MVRRVGMMEEILRLSIGEREGVGALLEGNDVRLLLLEGAPWRTNVATCSQL
jgi:hypothetical protein